MKGTPPNRGGGQRQTKATKAPSGMLSKKPASIKADPRSGKSVPGVGGGGSFAGSKRAPGNYDTTRQFAKNSGTKTGPGKAANFKKS